MSYKISYHSDIAKKSRLNIQTPIAVILMILALTNAVSYFSGQGIQLKEYLFSWVKPEIREAFSTFIEELEEGESVIACFESFCTDVFYESNRHP